MPEQGYFYGLLDLYAAEMTTEDTATTPPVYGEPYLVGKGIEVTITPAFREGKMYAGNVQTRNKKLIDSYGVKINPDAMTPATLLKMLPRVADGNGVQVVSGNTNQKTLALAFICTLDDGNKEYWWLYKGQFVEVTKTAKTDGEKIEYQTPTLEGTFIRRMNDNNLAVVADSSNASIPASVFSSWLTDVYEPTAGTPPTLAVTTQPADLALTVGAIDADDKLTAAFTVSDGGTPSYQWYRSASDSNVDGIPVGGANAASYPIPVNATAGTTYYYCVASSRGVTKTTEAAAVVVSAA